MKKTFISLFLLSLLTVFGSLSVKADTTLSFVYTQVGYDPGSGTKKYCSGNNADKDKWIADGDFNWNQTTDNVAQREVSSVKWTGVDQAQACTRSDVSFSAANYTLTLLTYRTNHHATMTLPSISINGGDPIYASEARWGVSSTETIVSNQFNYTNDNGKGAFETEVRLIYHTKINVANSYGISVSFPSGYDRFKDYVKTLTISQDAPATPTYEVSVNATNGTVSGTGSYAEGAEVTLTASPNENYSFTGWSSSDISIADASANPLVFMMPGNAVSVTANFAECTKHTVTLTAGDNGSVSGGGLQCDGSVTVTATPNSGYRFVNWTITSTSEVVSTDAKYTFTLSADISLTANFEVNPCSSSLTIEVEGNYAASGDYSGVTYPSSILFKEKDPSGSEYRQGCHGTGYVSFEASTNAEILIPVNIPVSGTYKVKAYAGRNKNMYINIYATTSTDQGSITYKSTTYYKQTYKNINGSHENDSFVESDYTDAVALPTGICLIGLYAEWSHSAWDQITITRTDGTAFCPNTITMQKSGDASAADPTSSPANTAMAGVEVTVTAGAPSDANHYFSGWTVSPENAVTFADATASTTTFVMPEADVTITANYGAVVSSEFTYTTSGSGSITCATESGSNVVSGTTIEMTAVPSTDYVFTGWTATAGSFSNASALTTNFTMPASAATVTANFAQVDNIICYGVESGSAGDGVGGGATISGSNIKDFDAFDGNNIVKLSYEGMSGTSAYASWDILKSNTYNSANSAGATGFGFYYKTETDADKVAMWFEPNTGGQQALQLNGTSNVWKYVYFAHSAAATWNQSQIRIYINGEQDGKSTANANGAIYLADIAATSITSKPDIDTYTYTRANASNSYGTLCLPMAGSVSGATLYSVAGKQEEGGKLYIVLEEQGTTLAAGEPYIFETDGSTLTATMSGPHRAVKEEANGLVGTYQQITAPAYNAPDDLNYVLALDDSNNTVFKKVGEGVTVGAYRAYINIKNAGDYSPASAAPGRKYIRFGIEGTEEEQAVEMIYDDASLRTRKIMQNGHLYILRDGHLFTAQGTQIK